MSAADIIERVAGSAIESAFEHALRAALALAGDEFASVLDRGTVGNDGAVAERVRGILAERSASRRAAESLSAPGP